MESTKLLLEQKGLSKRAELHLDSHSNMANYLQPETVSCITFNFGWLPGGDHKIFTQPETSIAAINQGLELLKPDGIMSLCIYYGRIPDLRKRMHYLNFFLQLTAKNIRLSLTVLPTALTVHQFLL